MYTNIYNQIKKEYDRRRKEAFDQLEERKAELYRRVPRLEEIEDEIHRAGLKYNKLQLTGLLTSDTAVRGLSEAFEALKSERRELLAKHGYAEDYLNPVFSCTKCSDTGVISSPDGGADTACTCYKQQLINYIYGESNLPTSGIEGFNSFRTDYYANGINEEKYGIKKSPQKQITGILENCRHFVDQFTDNGVKNLLFYGPTGVGKTFMAGCIAVELMNRGFTVLYQTAPALFNTIYEYRYKFSGGEGNDSSVYKDILEADLLIIDDLGTESPSAMRYAELLNIIDARYSNDQRKPCKTIIATNIHPKKLFDYYDERVVSRITGSYDIFWFAGDDIRRLKNLEAK